MIYFWAKLRKLFPWFILYVLLDIGCALFLAGILLYNSHYYSDAWISQGYLISAGEFLITLEAIRRMNTLDAYAPRNLLFVLSFSALLALTAAALSDAPRFWLGEQLEPSTWFRGGLQAWLGFSAWFLWSIPCRKGLRWTVQGRQLLMLSIYLLAACTESFAELHAWSLGRALPGSIIMGISLGIFATWSLVIWFAPRLTIAR